MKYRIKTEEEFVKEFGSNWREEIHLGWAEHMDYLFGKPIIDKTFKKVNNIDSNTIYRTNDGSQWNISKDMIMEVKEIDWDKELEEILAL